MTFGTGSAGKMGDRASISAGWRIFNLIATRLQLHLAAWPQPQGLSRRVTVRIFALLNQWLVGHFDLRSNACA
jgi:hypothetical protein